MSQEVGTGPFRKGLTPVRGLVEIIRLPDNWQGGYWVGSGSTGRLETPCSCDLSFCTAVDQSVTWWCVIISVSRKLLMRKWYLDASRSSGNPETSVSEDGTVPTCPRFAGSCCGAVQGFLFYARSRHVRYTVTLVRLPGAVGGVECNCWNQYFADGSGHLGAPDSLGIYWVVQWLLVVCTGWLGRYMTRDCIKMLST